MEISSPAFWNNSRIPAKYTADGQNTNPTLRIKQIPPGTKSLVIIVTDPDSPGTIWTHWIVWNIPPTENIFEDNVPGTQGVNDFNKKDYKGPAPRQGTHRYFFTVYALDSMLDISKESRRSDLEDAMSRHILAKAELIGIYSRN